MELHCEGTAASGSMETSNFAHVIFQNVGKSYLPNAALECNYTLTQFINPHHKDWVGIFKVGWSSARDYYTFLWSSFPENYVEGTAVSRTVVFQGYYVPSDDGDFYQFCYVTHKGEIRGASTPFQFRASAQTDDLMTVEEENNSDMLVVTTRASYMEKKMEELQKEKEEMMKEMELLQKEKEEMMAEQEKLQKACQQEKETCAQLRLQNQEFRHISHTLLEEEEEVKRRYKEVTARVLQLEEDLIGVTQKGLDKETELDGLRDRVKKLTQERDTLESQLKNERDEKELYKIHLRTRELENTKLMGDLQMLRSVEVNKENTVIQLREETSLLKLCIAEREKRQREKTQSSALRERDTLKEQLQQSEKQLETTRQQASLLASELKDVSAARDRSASELHSLHQEIKQLRQDQGRRAEAEPSAEAELRREVEDLKLRLHMAAEHYKEKYKECQKLQKQMAKGETKRTVATLASQAAEATGTPASPPLGSPVPVDDDFDMLIQEKLKNMNKEKSEKYKKCKQLLSEEKARSFMFADELAKMEVKWKEQLKINESLKLKLAAEEDRFTSQVAERGRKIKELSVRLTLLSEEKQQLLEELQKTPGYREVDPAVKDPSVERAPSVVLQYPLPYPQDLHLAAVVPQVPAELQFGNPYTIPYAKDGAGGELCPDLLDRHSPVGPLCWECSVVRVQPGRNQSQPDGLEGPEEQSNDDSEDVQSESPDSLGPPMDEDQTPFCFDSSTAVHKRCPLCEVIFPPNYDQSKFEEHVESHWKVCPMCGEHFPLDCEQLLFENHVLTHFEGNAPTTE